MPVIEKETGMGLDYYKALGLREDATEEEIKKGYRRIAKKYHPDSNPGDQNAERKFREAVEAYAVLGDGEKRRAYDQERKSLRRDKADRKQTAGRTPGSRPAEGFGFTNMSANFEQFFGFRPGSGEMDRDKLQPNEKTKTDPIDMTEMFERYMGIKKH